MPRTARVSQSTYPLAEMDVASRGMTAYNGSCVEPLDIDVDSFDNLGLLSCLLSWPIPLRLPAPASRRA